jgi:hypothetical protein
VSGERYLLRQLFCRRSPHDEVYHGNPSFYHDSRTQSLIRTSIFKDERSQPLERLNMFLRTSAVFYSYAQRDRGSATWLTGSCVTFIDQNAHSSFSGFGMEALPSSPSIGQILPHRLMQTTETLRNPRARDCIFINEGRGLRDNFQRKEDHIVIIVARHTVPQLFLRIRCLIM